MRAEYAQLASRNRSVTQQNKGSLAQGEGHAAAGVAVEPEREEGVSTGRFSRRALDQFQGSKSLSQRANMTSRDEEQRGPLMDLELQLELELELRRSLVALRPWPKIIGGAASRRQQCRG